MHAMDIISLRSTPAAGLFQSLTRRCPLTCAHCSTNSLMTSEEYAERIFLRFVEYQLGKFHGIVIRRTFLNGCYEVKGSLLKLFATLSCYSTTSLQHLDDQGYEAFMHA